MRRIFIAALVLAAPFLATAALAGPREDVLYGISRCGGIADDRTWLDCLYGAAQPMRSQLGLPPASAAQQKLVPPAIPGLAAPEARNTVAPQAEPSYSTPGFFARLVKPTIEKPELPTTLTSYKFDGAGFFTVTLANGETWVQDGGDSLLAHWNKRPQSYPAQILPGSSDYHRLKIDGQLYMVNKN